MSNNQPSSWSAYNFPPWHEELEHTTFKTVDIPIGGKLVSVTATLTEAEMLQMSDRQAKDLFKQNIVELLAIYMLENNLVETTQYVDKLDYSKKVNVRCYLAKDDQIKILRMQYAKHI